MLSSRSLPLASVLIGLAVFGSSPDLSAQTTSDPFLPGMRWSEAATTQLPWIPRRVSFAGSDQAIWAGRALGTPGVTLYTGTNAGSLGEALDLPLPGAVGAVEVQAGGSLDELFVAAQYPTTGVLRATDVSRHAAFGTTTLWTRTLAPEVNGNASLGAGGGKLYCARFDAGLGRVWLDRLDPADGASLFAIETPATALRGLALNEAGNRVALCLGDRLAVFDRNGVSLASIALGSSTEAFALSADGLTLVAGDMGQVHIWRDAGAGYVSAGSVLVGGDWMATRASLSADGMTLGVGWWDAKTGASIRFQMWDLGAGVKLHDLLQTGVLGGLQNFPAAVAVDPSGQRLALGAWGSGGPDPQLVLLDRDLTTPVYSTYLAGSVMDLALDDTGTRLAVAVKAGHANQFSTTGFVQLFDTGERDLQLVGNLQTGAPFQLTSLHSGSAATLFVFGAALAPPAPLAGIHGLAWIDPSLPFSLFAVPADGAGRADLVGLVPSDPALVGWVQAVQAVFAGTFGWQFSTAAPLLTVL